jgi:hypothetical protein
MERRSAQINVHPALEVQECTCITPKGDNAPAPLGCIKCAKCTNYFGINALPVPRRTFLRWHPVLSILPDVGRPRKIVDPVEVEKMAAVGCTPEEIGGILNCSARTVDQRFCKPFKKGQQKLRHTLKRVLLREAVTGNTAALIFAAKVYCGLREPRDDAVTVNVNQTALSIDDETKRKLATMHAMIRRETAIGDSNGDRN